MTLIRQRRAIPILVVVGLVAAGMVLIVFELWRPGLAVLALAAGTGGVLRGVLPESQIGVLAVRSRPFDTVFLLAIAAILGVLVVIPWT